MEGQGHWWGLMAAIMLSPSLSQSKDLGKIYNVIKQVESNGNPYAIGDGGKAYGIVQIHEACVNDVNRYYGTDYTHHDMFDERCAEEVFNLYLNMGVVRFENVYARPPSEGEIVRMWNGGIYRGYRIEATKKYYNRYKKFKGLCHGK